MAKVQKPSDSECYMPTPETFSIYLPLDLTIKLSQISCLTIVYTW
jgi:hypothetical protein